MYSAAPNGLRACCRRNTVKSVRGCRPRAWMVRCGISAGQLRSAARVPTSTRGRLAERLSAEAGSAGVLVDVGTGALDKPFGEQRLVTEAERMRRPPVGLATATSIVVRHTPGSDTVY